MWFHKKKPRPTSEDAARRLLILKHVVVSALTAPPREMLSQMTSQWPADELLSFQKQAQNQRDEFWGRFRHAGLWHYLSPLEKSLAHATAATMTHQQQLDASWRVESAQVLVWALGMMPVLPPYDKPANHDILKQIPSDDATPFIASVRLRAQSDIDAARSAAELWSWRSRTRELIERGDVFPSDARMKAAGFLSYDDVIRVTARKAAEDRTIPPSIDGDFPTCGKAYRDLTADEWAQTRSITSERHFTLNWLCGYAPKNKWDETPTDT